jgi:Leucine-rich repeat (LRR) protein
MATVITSITGLQNLTNLENFNADYNALTTVNLSGLANLLFVDISDNDLLSSGDPSLTSVNLSGCTSLQTLRLDDSDFSAGIPSLAGLTSLTELDLDQCSISGVVYLTGLSALESFDLYGNLGVTSVILPESNITDANLQDTGLTQTGVNNVLQWLDGSGVENGYISTEGGTSAAPTEGGATAVTNLQAKGWSVIVNEPTTTTTTSSSTSTTTSTSTSTTTTTTTAL